MRINTALTILTLLRSKLSYEQKSYIYSQPMEARDEWCTNNLKALLVDTTRIYQFLTQVQINPITNTNLEDVGVKPDYEIEDKAIDTTLKLIFKEIKTD